MILGCYSGVTAQSKEKKLVKDPDEISVLGLMEFDWKETSFDLEFLAVNSQF